MGNQLPANMPTKAVAKDKAKAKTKTSVKGSHKKSSERTNSSSERNASKVPVMDQWGRPCLDGHGNPTYASHSSSRENMQTALDEDIKKVEAKHKTKTSVKKK